MQKLGVLVASLFLFTASLIAQATSTITGTVVDQSGAVVAGARIEVVNIATKVVSVAGGSSTGNYVVTVIPGKYEVSVTKSGFKKVIATGLEVLANASLREDFQLELGADSTTVEVVGIQDPLLKTESGGQTHNVPIEQADNLPLFSIGQTRGFGAIRNALDSLNLLPGTQFTSDTSALLGGFNAVVRVNGMPNNSESIRVEGQDALNGLWRSVPSMTQQGVEAIQEISIQTSNYAAEFGQAAGGYFNYTMKSGTNQYHGSAYDYFVNEVLNAGTSYSNAGAGSTGSSQKCTAAEWTVTPTAPSGAWFCTNGEHSKAKQRRADYGFTIGGPVKLPKLYDGHDKTFFFFNFEQFREIQATASSATTVPTNAYRGLDAGGNPLGYYDLSGTISHCTPSPNVGFCLNGVNGVTNSGTTYVTKGGVLATDNLLRNIAVGTIYNPFDSGIASDGSLYRNPFPGQRIPYTMVDPVAAQIAASVPMANDVNPNLLAPNYHIPYFTNFRHTTNPSVKIDHSISSTVKISGYWSLQHTYSPNSNGLDPALTGVIPTDDSSQTIRLNYDQTVTPTLLFHVGLGYLYTYNPGAAPQYDTTSLGKTPPFACGSPAVVAGNCTTPSPNGFPGFTASQYPSIIGLSGGQGGIGITIGAGSLSNVNQWEEKPTATASLTWVKNNHTFKAGGELTRDGIIVHLQTRANGNLNVSGNETRNPWEYNGQVGVMGSSGYGYASFLLGQVDSFAYGPAAAGKLGNYGYGLYLQDTWRVTRKLTVNYGLRYDFQTYLKEAYGRMSSADWNGLNTKVGVLGTVIYEGDGPGRCNCAFSDNYKYGIAPRLDAAYQLSPKTVIRGGVGVAYGTTAGNDKLSSSFADFFTINAPGVGIPAMKQISAGNPYGNNNPYGFPVLGFPDFDPNKYPQPSICTYSLATTCYVASSPSRTFDRNARPPRIFQYSFGIQREVVRNLVIEASYVGNRGIWFNAPGLNGTAYNGLTNPLDMEQYGINPFDGASAGLMTTGLYTASGFHLTANPKISALGLLTPPYPGFPLTGQLIQKVRPHPEWSGVPPYLGNPFGKTWYDSLQIKATKRYSHGLDLQSSFTWSKELALGQVSDNSFGSSGPNGTIGGPIIDPYNPSTSKGLSPFSQPFRLTIAGTYNTPGFRADSKFLKIASFVLRDWQIGAVLQYTSGALLAIPASSNALLGELGWNGATGGPFQTRWNLRTTSVNGTQTLNPPDGLLLVDPNCHCFDPNKDFITPQPVSVPVNGVNTFLNPVWVDAPTGYFGGSANSYNNYRWQRQPSENMNFGRNFRIGKEHKQSIQIRAEFQNVFNRHFYGTPNVTNPVNPAQTISPIAPESPTIGALTSGFGVTPQTLTSGRGPRTGLLVARFTF